MGSLSAAVPTVILARATPVRPCDAECPMASPGWSSLEITPPQSHAEMMSDDFAASGRRESAEDPLGVPLPQVMPV